MALWDDDRLRKVLLGRKAISIVPFPGVDGLTIGVRVLTEHDNDEARGDAAQFVDLEAKRLKLDLAQLSIVEPDIQQREKERQIVYRAFVEADGTKDAKGEPKRAFPGPAAVRGLDAPLVETLYQIYVTHQNACSPLIELDASEIEELADALKKAQSPLAILGEYDAPTLRLLVLSLVNQRSN